MDDRRWTQDEIDEIEREAGQRWAAVQRRQLECWNACAGMDDPQTEVAALRQQLAERDQRIAELETFKLDHEHYGECLSSCHKAMTVRGIPFPLGASVEDRLQIIIERLAKIDGPALLPSSEKERHDAHQAE